MHYFIRLDPDREGGREVELDVGADGIRLLSGADAAGPADAVSAELRAIPGGDTWVLRVGRRVHRIVAHGAEGRGRWSLLIDGVPVEVEALDARTRHLRDMTTAMAGASGPKPVVAPMPGLVMRVEVEVGDVVEAGQGVVIVEAMKMENELAAEAAGRVVAVPVAEGEAVEKGTVLVELEALDEEGEA